MKATKRYLIVLAPVLFLLCSIRKEKTQNCVTYENNSVMISDTIWWKDSIQLKWSDFMGKPENGVPYLAISNTGIHYKIKRGDGFAIVSIKSYFNRVNSWAVEDSVDDYVLRHELFHFSITEFYARKLRRDILQLKTSSDEVSHLIKKQLYHYLKQSNDLHDLYDMETNHSIDSIAQKKWEGLITDSLEFYSDYSNTEVRLIRNE